nr:hypothetical protein [uncultured Hyphomonas sp.]
MGNWKTIGAACAGLALTACASNSSSDTRWTRTSFSPPIVDHSSFSPSLDDGIKLLDEYIRVYRIAGGKNANARQFFDVPAMLAAIGGATAVAFGANADVAIGTGAFSAIAASGKGYYAPNERADAYYDAVMALSCMQEEAIGLEIQFTPVETEVAAISAADATKRAAADDANKMLVEEEARSFLLLKNAALNVENTLRIRLSTKATMSDPNAIAAMVIQYQKEIELAEQARSDGEDTGSKIQNLLDKAGTSTSYRPNLEELAPKLKECALLAQ